MTFAIRHAEPSDYGRVIPVVDAWWGGREMAGFEVDRVDDDYDGAGHARVLLARRLDA